MRKKSPKLQIHEYKKTELMLKSPLSTTYVPNFKAAAQKLTSWMLIKSMWLIWSLHAYLMRQNFRYRTCPRSLANKCDWQSLKVIGKKCGREAANGDFGGRPPARSGDNKTLEPNWLRNKKTLIHSDILGLMKAKYGDNGPQTQIISENCSRQSI